MPKHRIWFDILTPKQILFFKPLIDRLLSNGHEVLATSRRYRENEPLAEIYGLKLKFVGERGGVELRDQLRASIERLSLLLPIVEDFEPDLSMSVASADCARISFGLRVKHLAVNDSPHSVIAGKLSLPLTFHLFTPWIIPYNAWAIFGIKRRQITKYKALDPVVWLRRRTAKRIDINLDESKKTIVVRLEESHAPYMLDTDKSYADRLLSSLAKEFKGYNLVALCRYKEQFMNLKRKYGDTYIIPDKVIDGPSLLEVTDVFIGMGGTMTVEAALTGVPTISTFQGKLFTINYLASKGLVYKEREPERVVKRVKLLLEGGYKKIIAGKAKRLLEQMEDPVDKIASYINELE